MNVDARDDSESDEELYLVHVPALVAVLLSKEKEKGSPLTKEEVLEIADKSQCVAMPLFAKKKVEDGRGYLDIDPENAWDEWQVARNELFNS